MLSSRHPCWLLSFRPSSSGESRDALARGRELGGRLDRRAINSWLEVPGLGLLPNTRLALSYPAAAAFLRVLADTGSVHAGSRAASPHSPDRGGAYSTFLGLMQRDPEFAAQVGEAKAHALGKLESEMVRRAAEGTKRPIYQQGRLVGYENVYSDNLLMFALRALDPAKYNEKRQIELKGDVTHRVVGLLITPHDLLGLNRDERFHLDCHVYWRS